MLFSKFNIENNSLKVQSLSPTVISDFSFGRLIGKGSTAHVFQANHLPTGQIVAIKKVKLEKEDPIHLLRELMFVSSLRHPNVVMFKDCFFSF